MSDLLSKQSKIAILLLTGTVGLTSSFFPDPLGYIGMLELISGLVILLVMGHRSAFRQHKYGIFSQWTDPKVFIRMELNEREKFYVILGAVMTTSTIISYFILIVLNPP